MRVAKAGNRKWDESQVSKPPMYCLDVPWVLRYDNIHIHLLTYCTLDVVQSCEPRFVAESKFRSERQKATAMIKVWMVADGGEGKCW